MKKEQEKAENKVVLPCGKCCQDTCGDCGWSDPGEKDSNGKIWCSKKHEYYYPWEDAYDACGTYFKRRW